MPITKVLAETGVWFVIVSPILLYYRKRDSNSTLLIGLAFAYYSVEQILIQLPRYYHDLDFIGGYWNWMGKLYAITGSILFYVLTRSYFQKNDFVTLRQAEGSLRPVGLVAISMLLVTSIGFFFSDGKPFNVQTLLFQLSMPGLDEELSFRGIMLGMLATALSEPLRIGRWTFGHPASWVTGLLFGMAHGLRLTNEWAFQINWNVLFYTFSFGWILAWMTLKSRSILIPTLLHNVSNTLGNLLMMLK